MIIKNEAKNLNRLFSSLYKYIDYYVISDTGSTDNTVQLISELANKYNIKGFVTCDKWVDFAHNRNISLQNAVNAKNEGKHNCNWLLFIDADEELIVKNPLFKNNMKEDTSYMLYINDKGKCIRGRSIINIKNVKWYWKGAIHNYITSDNTDIKFEFLDEVYIKYNDFEGSKSEGFINQIDKVKKDIELIDEELIGVLPTQKNFHRFFQLANECFEIKDFDNAIRNYEIICANNFEPEMLYEVNIKLGIVYFEKFKNIEKALEYFNKAIEIDNERKDAYYYLGKLYQNFSEYEKAIEFLNIADKLPFPKKSYYTFDLNIYTWKIKYDLLIIYKYLKNKEQCLSLFDELKNNNDIPKQKRTLMNLLIQSN